MGLRLLEHIGVSLIALRLRNEGAKYDTARRFRVWFLAPDLNPTYFGRSALSPLLLRMVETTMVRRSRNIKGENIEAPGRTHDAFWFSVSNFFFRVIEHQIPKLEIISNKPKS
jgi:hypothetical protein